MVVPQAESGDRPGATPAIWTTADRRRRFLVPEPGALPPGGLVLRTAAGHERAVDEAAVLPFEVSAAEAEAWAREELRRTLGALRGRALEGVEALRHRTAGMRAENRRAWREGVAAAPPEVHRAAGQLRGLLRDVAATLRRAAAEHRDRS